MSNRIEQMDRISAWERHGQTIIASILLLLLGWVGFTVNDNSKETAVLKSQMTLLSGQIATMQSQLSTGMNDRYRGSDAQRDFTAAYNEMRALRDAVNIIAYEQSSRGPRISTLEKRVEEIQQQMNDLIRKK